MEKILIRKIQHTTTFITYKRKKVFSLRKWGGGGVGRIGLGTGSSTYIEVKKENCEKNGESESIGEKNNFPESPKPPALTSRRGGGGGKTKTEFGAEEWKMFNFTFKTPTVPHDIWHLRTSLLYHQSLIHAALSPPFSVRPLGLV